MINSRNLFKLQSRLTVSNKTIPVKTIEKDYVLSWILIGIAKSKINSIVTFKGGTALKKFYFPDYRFSEDLDFTFLEKISIEEFEKMLLEVYQIVLQNSNINLSLKTKELHENGYTFFINFSGPLGANISRNEIKTDFTTNEHLINKPVSKTLLKTYNEYTDIPDNIRLKVYPLEEIFSEKYLSILDKSRNEPRDIYDLWYLASNRCLDLSFLALDIKCKGNAKGVDMFNIIEILNYKESKYRSLWINRLDNQMIGLPYFDKVYRELKKYLRSINNALK